MREQELLERITLAPEVMVGKPVIRGTRLTVEYVLNLLAHGATVSEILREYKGLTPGDVQACILFATKCLEDTAFMPLRKGDDLKSEVEALRQSSAFQRFLDMRSRSTRRIPLDEIEKEIEQELAAQPKTA